MGSRTSKAGSTAWGPCRLGSPGYDVDPPSPIELPQAVDQHRHLNDSCSSSGAVGASSHWWRPAT